MTRAAVVVLLAALALAGCSGDPQDDYCESVEDHQEQLTEIAARVGDGRLRANLGITVSLDEAVAHLGSGERLKGKTVITIRP